MAKKQMEALPPIDELDPEAKKAMLNKALTDISKKYGEGSIMRLGDASHMQVEAIPTGSLSLDLALGIGGVPRARITEIYGPESSGKTTICLHIVAEAQRIGGTAAFIDMEHALDPSYAKKLGVNVSQLLVSQPDTGEQALEICETLVRSCAVDVIVIDSVAALVPRTEIEGAMGDSSMGVQARLMSQALRKLSGAINHTKTALIFTNQLRQKIGVMFGNPETTPGGLALKFYSSVRLDVRRIATIKSGTEIIGNHIRVRVVKNKVAPPFTVAEFDIMYNEGISKLGDIVDLGAKLDIITKRGSFYSYHDQRIGQGRDNARDFLKANPQIADEIEQDIRTFASGSEVSIMGYDGKIDDDDDDTGESGESNSMSEEE